MLTGTCHCDAVTWAWGSEPKPVTACNCSSCARMGVLWIYDTEQEDAQSRGATKAYARADHGAFQCHHSVVCGKTISWRSAQPNANCKTAIAVNLRRADAPDDMMVNPIRHIDGRHAFKEQPGGHRTAKDI